MSSEDIFNEENFLDEIENYKSVILTNIKILIDEHNLSLLKNNYTNKVYIDGINQIRLYNNITIYNSTYRNILFLDDLHRFDNTKRNIYLKRYQLYLSTILYIKNLNIKYKNLYKNLSIENIRLLIIFINKNFYEIITENLFNNEIIGIDELLYYSSTNFDECFDIFIENDRFDILDMETQTSNTFLYLSDFIFFNCGDKLFYDKKDKIIKDPYPNSLNTITHNKIMCNYNIRYHRADIRSNYYDKYTIAYKHIKDTENKGIDIINYDEFNKLIEDYIDYIFYDGDKTDTLFYNKHLNELYMPNLSSPSSSNLKIKLKELKQFFEISSKNIKKQFDKSIFKKNLSINDLKKIIIATENEEEKFDTTTKLESDQDLTFNDIPNMRLFSITINLYSIFRMFIDNWENKDRQNLSDDCNKLNYPKNIIYFSGGSHTNWIILFINNIFIFNNQPILKEDLNIYSSKNYLELNIFNYLKLKEFLFIKNETKIFNHSKKEYELYLEYNNLNLSNLENMDYIEFYSYYDIFINILIYYSNDKSLTYIDLDLIRISTYINLNEAHLNDDLNEAQINDDLNNLIMYYKINFKLILNYISDVYLINQLKYIKIYFILFKKYILNTIIILKYIINKINKIYFRNNINYDIDMDIDIYKLYYNKENLSYLIKDINIIIDNIDDFFLDKKIYFDMNIDINTFLNSEYSKIINNNYKKSLIKNITKKFYCINKIIDLIEQNLSSDILNSDIINYYSKNLLIFLNNTIIMLCHYYNINTKLYDSSTLDIKCVSIKSDISNLIDNYMYNNIIS